MDYEPAQHTPTWSSIGAGVLIYLVLIGGLATVPVAAAPGAASASRQARGLALHQHGPTALSPVASQRNSRDWLRVGMHGSE
jgi:hypothetical protein